MHLFCLSLSHKLLITSSVTQIGKPIAEQEELTRQHNHSSTLEIALLMEFFQCQHSFNNFAKKNNINTQLLADL